MKKQEPYVVFQIKKEDGTSFDAQVSTRELRKALDKVKNQKDMSNISLTINYKDESFNISMSIAEIRKHIKQSELLLSNPLRGGITRYMVDLTQQFACKKVQPIVGRENEIEKIWFYLSQKTRNNVFLIGERDVGKSAIAFEIVRQISTNECPKEFYDSRVLMLRPELIIKIEHNFEAEHVVNKILGFLKKNKDKIILYIDKALYMKMDEYLILTLYNCIMRLNIPVITTASVEDFNNYFLKDPSISKYVNDIYIEEPDIYELEPMLKKHISRLKKQYGLNISKEIVNFGIFTSLLNDTVSVNPGKTINIFERAFLEAKRKEKESVDKESILSCYKSYLNLYNKMTEEEKRKTAYHETGHYLLFVLSPNINNLKISCVSILPMMGFLGVTWPYMLEGKKMGYSREYFIDNIAVDLAGRIAEAQISNEITTGASQDLESASAYAERILMAYGLSDAEDFRNRSYLEDGYFVKDYMISDDKKKRLDEEVQKLINEGYERAEKVIMENKELLSIIAERLMVEEILTGEQLEEICVKYKNKK